MAIAFDAAVNAAASSSPLTFAHTVGAGSDRILFVGVEHNGTTTVSGITYNGVALTKINAQASGVMNFELWYLSNPASGSNNVVVTTVGAVTLLNASAASYTGAVGPSGVPDSQGTSSGFEGTTDTRTSVANNCWHIGFFAGLDTGNGLTAGAGATARTVLTSGFGMFDSNGPITPAGSHSMTVTISVDTLKSNGATFAPGTFTPTVTAVNHPTLLTLGVG